MIKTKIIFWIWVFTVFSIWNIVSAFDYKTDCVETTFILTAYYSPKKDQIFYFKEDFQADVTLNGKWYTWASWKWVFNWMLAAPKKYDFGTKIIFPTLWIWEVADRGGAIVESWNLWHWADRIDVWMWNGEEWLVKALTFGKQTMIGYICSWAIAKNIRTSIDLKKVPMYKWFFDSAIRLQQLKPWRKDVRVWKLQEYLIKLWYLKKNQDTWNYWPETQNALCSYQVKKWLSSKKYADCGHFGPNTRATMKQEVKAKNLLPADMFTTTSIQELKVIWQKWDLAKQITKVAESTATQDYFDKPFTKWVYNEKVVKLQELLKKLWYYSGSLNWIYDTKISNWVYLFQKNYWVLQWYENDPNVKWYMWPRTRAALNQKYIEMKEKERLAALAEIIGPSTKTAKASKSFQFYRSYTKWEWPNQEIRILQKFLSNQKFYSGSINWVYDKKTMDAVQKFQVKYWLVSSWSSVTVQWYMWPKTREKVNQMID